MGVEINLAPKYIRKLIQEEIETPSAYNHGFSGDCILVLEPDGPSRGRFSF